MAKARVLDESEIMQVEALAAYLTAGQIADYFGVKRTTFYEILKRQSEVAEHYKKGKAKCLMEVAKGLIEKARDGDTTSAIFYLKTQGGWRENNQNEAAEAVPLQISFTVQEAKKDVVVTKGQKRAAK